MTSPSKVSEATLTPASLDGALHIWMACPDELQSEPARGFYLHMLDAEEGARYHRFQFDRDKVVFLAAHALLRLCLSHYGTLAPHEWRFVRGAKGKPSIDPACGHPLLRFNLTHTQGLVACAVATDHQCGIDVEQVRPMRDMMGVAETVFSASELIALRALPETEHGNRFFSLWTLKEAYIKASGLGLSAPLKNISFDIAASSLHVEDLGATLNTSGPPLLHLESIGDSHMLAAVAAPRNAFRTLVTAQLALCPTPALTRIRSTELTG